MFPDGERDRFDEVDVQVSFEPGDPPCGHVTRVDPLAPTGGQGAQQPHALVPFTGWLGLLRVLSDLLAELDGP